MENEQGAADAQEDSQEMGSMDPKQLLDMVGQGLTKVVEGLGQSGAPKEIMAPFQSALEAYTAGYQMLQQGAGSPQGGAAPMEAGAAEAQPSGSMRMRG